MRLTPSSSRNRSLCAPSHPLDRLEVGLDGDEGVGRGRLRAHHVLGGDAGGCCVNGTTSSADRPAAPEVAGACARSGRRRRGRLRAAGRAGAGGAAGAGAGAASRDGRPARRGRARTSVAGDPAAQPGAGDRRRVEAVLGDEPADDRRKELAARRRRRSVGGGAGAGATAAAPAAGAAAGGGAGGRRGGRARRSGCGRRRCGGGPAARARRGAGRPARRRAAAAGAGRRRRRRRRRGVAPTSTVSPSGTRISVSTPAAGEGTSESTLSVETSKSGSSWATVVADLLQPADDRALGHRLAELGHRDVSQRGGPFR